MNQRISELIKTDAELMETELKKRLSFADEKIPVIFDAMRYSVLDGGKRVRPFLVIEFCKLAYGDPRDALPFASAIEMIHSYSLVHDDLPCMDNDDLRRGKPTVHRKFGYANALLCGDALLTYAFETAVSGNVSNEQKVDAVTTLAANAGVFGMCGGQQLDLYGEDHKIDFDALQNLHALKTGALITCACELGCIAAGLDRGHPLRRAAVEYAKNIGVTFQIIDDILDVTSDEKTLGKPIGSDSKQGKTTYLSFMSIDEAKKSARELTDRAVRAICSFNGSDVLCDFAEYLYSRDR